MQPATMMDVPLTIELVVDRAERWMRDVQIVSRRPDRSLHRTTYGEVAARARRLARALVGAGIRPGDRVATLMWNDAIPRTSAGKFKKTELRATYSAHFASVE